VPWLNVTCYGVLGGALIVGIEIPASQRIAAKTTSVNISGPTAAVIRRAWNADAVLVVE